MWTNKAQRTIAAPAEQIFTLWCNFAERSSWDDHDQWAHLQGPLAVGTTIHLKTQGAPPAKVCITEFEPGHRIVTEGVVPLAKCALCLSFKWRLHRSCRQAIVKKSRVL